MAMASDTDLASLLTARSAGRALNFSAGPSVMPEEVLRRAREDIWDLAGTGIGILEHSHRGPAFDRVLEETFDLVRRVVSVPDGYEVLFVQGGATTLCWQIPANFLPPGRTADYFETGKWARDAMDEVHHYGVLHTAGSSRETNFDRIPDRENVRHSDNPAYVHFCWNNTIFGTEWQWLPDTPGESFLIADATSNIFSRPMDVSRFGVVYAGAQKQLGPAGTVMLIARRDLLERPARDLPTMQRLGLIASKESRYNTPPTFGIYLVGRVCEWILRWGEPGRGNHLERLEAHNRSKAQLLYDVIDAGGFYRGHAIPRDRSLMNVTFRTPSAELDAAFLAEAEAEGFGGLAGHRAAGGMRASIYNAFPREGVEALASFMREFERRRG